MKEKNQVWITIFTSIVALLALVICIWQLSNGGKAKGDGIVTIELLDVDKSIIKNQEITFQHGDSIATLIEENFENVVFENGMLMEIEDYKTPDDWHTFIGIYVDDVMSNYGLSDANFTFEDGTKISLIITEYVSE